MIRIPFLIVFSITVLSFLFSGLIVAQTNDREISLLESSVHFPDFIVAPRENLRLFELSTISTSTFGKTTKGLSNLEVNQPREKAAKERAFGGDTPSEDVEPRNVNFFPLPLNTTEKFFKWIDENGVIHVTNDPDAVP